ncbi:MULTISPECIES: nucleotide 5'-monophosphate nucleosidase PpnN [unclassified Marinobacter]|uniref:nucleotide 5'-monophosphate nucleosidase PpnN n=1 Tax=unclassified Marinobacter TaxID=83889 RepID=UPI00200BD587|nr:MULTISPECIES: nucleotide 5'-monophosphate nucleosidase PpnN [unclassified Marinobacter]MCL1478108.1 nucleotide 5'-monophosphate nucleosidase PpnN [Marinobacter sp.]MCL1483104.1 nucleotide 5'-monophosphate nucleosidase PpnN [Marinobacter sp.]UQG55734.1 nucleotide 5'-monophosphate nucleosidase PpnN [Marinobacter sp. M4C]UQG64538.1 nucleotide 5'-monophosphate nucleosidase PpnN [Marinobacter sp. M2C]UQG68817.1 nucleotide 5'-monophosphate nucleosidase PpnN [Marinobacter sp. M1C]
MNEPTINALVSPEGSLEILSNHEVNRLKDRSEGGLYKLFRQCALAVLNTGVVTDDCQDLMTAHSDFEVRLVPQPRGLKLELINAPHHAFVDNEMLRANREHLFSVLRDIVYTHSSPLFTEAKRHPRPEDLTNMVFHILRNARVLQPGRQPDMVVCWGGHSISHEEYQYSKEVGHQLGLRELSICTGCGPGAMKGPMKGATIGHAKQRVKDGRYIGITEPGIIGAEAPNPIVNELVIMPDIEKRLEAFVRLGHGVIVFPGGVGTAEEILYLLGILLHPDNADIPFPVVFTGRRENADYFEMIDKFIRNALGDDAAKRYEIIIDDPVRVARTMKLGMQEVETFRRAMQDAYYFNWTLKIDPVFQLPFEPDHANMRALALHRDQPVHMIAANLRKAFSGIVAGNVKEEGVRKVQAHGPFEIAGDPSLIQPLEAMLEQFVAQNRMKLPGTSAYRPSYRIINRA